MSYDDETRTFAQRPSTYTPTPAFPISQAAPRAHQGPSRLFPLALAAAALLAAALFLLLPLPTFDVLGTPVGFCGPGPTSDNALQVLVDPSVVSGQDDLTTKESVDTGTPLQAWCLGKAKARGYDGLAVGGGGLMVALGITYLQARRRP